MGPAGLDRHDPTGRDGAQSIDRAQQRGRDGGVGVGIAALAHGRHQRIFDRRASLQVIERVLKGEQDPATLAAAIAFRGLAPAGPPEC